MTRSSMGIAAAVCAALTVAVGAKAQEMPCSAQTAGQLLCQQSKLCQCQYFTGGALADTSAGYRWDCGVFRPRCESTAVPLGPEAGPPEMTLAGEPPASLAANPVEIANTALDSTRRKIMSLAQGEDDAPGALGWDLVAVEGLDAPPDEPGAAERLALDDPPAAFAEVTGRAAPFDLVAAVGLDAGPGEPAAIDRYPPPAMLAVLAGWTRSLWQVPRPERRISKAPVPRLGDRFAQQAARAEQTRIRLEVEIADLQASLDRERQRVAALEGVRDDLDLHRVRLTQQLQDMGEIQQATLDRLTDHTSLDIAVFEETVAMAGLDVTLLLPEDRIDGQEEGQGGPFIPGQFLTEPDPVEAAETSLSLLDEQIERWDRLQELLRRLPLAAPLEQYRISSAYGPRKDPVNGRLSRHLGLDFRAKLSTPVLSTAPGKVRFAAWKGRYGRLVEIDHGYGIRTRYAHLRKILVKKGQQVGHRETIALLGSSGRSTGPHVHYEVLVDGKPHDPMNFLKAGIHVFKTAEQESALSDLNKDP